MPFSAKRRVSSVHWSVDFVEHLRAVHFGLVTVSAALIILVSGSRDTRISRALTQATQIVEAESRWTEVQSTLYLTAAQSVNLPTNRAYLVKVNATAVPSRGALITIDLTPEVFAKYERWKFSGADMEKSPRTLSDFRTWWDKLHAGVEVLMPKLTEYEGETCSLAIWTRDDKGKIDVLDMFNSKECALKGFGPADITADSYAAKPALNFDAKLKVINMTATASKIKTTLDSERNMTREIEVSVWHSPQTTKMNETALQTIFPGRTGSYDVAFRELAGVSGDLTTIDLRGVPARIQSMEPKGEQNIEAFGLKVPSADITRWGTILLLAVQFYFWLHLHELNRKIEPSSPGWEVAWIGVYKSTTAAISMFISVCVLPVTAVLILARRIPADVEQPHSTWISWALAVLACLVSLLMAGGTAERLHRLRHSPASPEPQSTSADNGAL